jgi:hypothetical protein
MQTKICQQCQKTIFRKKGSSRFSWEIKRFCSRDCLNTSRRGVRFINSGSFKRGFIPWNTGKKLSKEIREKISQRHKGKIPWNKGKKLLEISGENSVHWISDRNLLKKYKDSSERNSPLYKRWRLNVWQRDNFKCMINNHDCKGRIEVHHILSWREFVELRYEINNGITLCHAHHPKARAEEKRLIPTFQELVSMSVSKE